MEYLETLPDKLLSHHVESYWEFRRPSPCEGGRLELFMPTCTFTLLILSSPCNILQGAQYQPFMPGAYLIGQLTTSIHLQVTSEVQIIGIKLKPFALATLFPFPLSTLSDGINKIESLFPPRITNQLTDPFLFTERTLEDKKFYLDGIMASLLKCHMVVDEDLRAKLNFIMDRRGMTRISDIQEYFGTSRVSLHKHFIQKVGLTPKAVCKIWRMNHLFELRHQNPQEKLTSLCLEAGFYDQSHFIKEFRALFSINPNHFFKQPSALATLEMHQISQRFNHQYDPR